jgi:hypothetical protein
VRTGCLATETAMRTGCWLQQNNVFNTFR